MKTRQLQTYLMVLLTWLYKQKKHQKKNLSLLQRIKFRLTQKVKTGEEGTHKLENKISNKETQKNEATLEKGDAQSDEKEDNQNKEGYQIKEDTLNIEANPKKEYNQNIENAQSNENHSKANGEDKKMNQKHETSKEDEIKIKETPAEREIQEKEKVSFNVCQLVCEDAKYLRNHRIKEHKQHMNDPLMEPLYSCDQCDFDTEDIDAIKLQ